MRQIKGKEVRFLLDTANHDQSLAEIRLCMSRRMVQRHEHLFGRPLPGPDIVFDDGVGAIKAALIAQTLKDALRGVTLLARPNIVFGKPLVDLIRERIQLRAVPDRRRPPIPEWL